MAIKRFLLPPLDADGRDGYQATHHRHRHRAGHLGHPAEDMKMSTELFIPYRPQAKTLDVIKQANGVITEYYNGAL